QPADPRGSQPTAWALKEVVRVAAILGVGVAVGIAGSELRHMRTPPHVQIVEKQVFVDREVLVPSPLVVAPLSSAKSASSASASPPPPVPESRDASLKRERMMIEAARSALARRDPSAALMQIEEHAQRFPKGQFAESRDALRIQALVLAGRMDEARARGEL